MTLEEFERRLRENSPNYQGSVAQQLEQKGKTLSQHFSNRNNIVNDTRNLISNNPNTKEVLKAPISQTMNKKAGIDVNNLKHSRNSFIDNLSSGFYGIAHLAKPIGKAMLNTFNNALPYYYNVRENIDNSAESFKNKDFKNGINYSFNAVKDTLLAPIDYVTDSVRDFGKRKLEEKGIDNKILSNIDNLNIVNEDKYNNVKTTKEEIQKMVDKEYDKVTPNKTLTSIAGVGSDIGVSMALNALGIPSSVTYGVISGADTYGNTDNVREIAGDTAIGALTGAITDVTTPVIKEASKSIIPKVGQKLIPTLASNYGSNFIGGYMGSYGANTIGQQIKNMNLYLTPEQQKEINDNALSFAIFSSLLGGTKDTIKDIKISKNSLNKDVNDTIQKLQDANAQLERTDYTSNNVIRTRLKARGNEIIAELENKNYLLNNKNKELAVRLLRTAYDSGNINNINYANNQVIALLGSAEMNSKLSQGLSEITDKETSDKIILANEKLINSNITDENKYRILDEATSLYDKNKNVDEVVDLIEKQVNNVNMQSIAKISYSPDVKQYDDLTGSSNLKFRKLDNGDIDILLYSDKGELINQFRTISEKDSIKQLGEDITRYIYNNAGKELLTLELPSISKENTINKYQMEHRPTKNGVGYDITSTDSIGKDIYTNPENYVDMSLKHNQESYNALVDIRDNPNAEVIIYRASPKNELNEGDWITLSKSYAEMEAKKENVPVNEFKVKAKDIQFAGDDINEFGYFPQKNQKVAPIPEDLMNKNSAPTPEKIINEYNGYTNKEIQNISSDKIIIANNDNDILDFVKNAKKQNSNKKIFVSKIIKDVATRIKNKLGINVDDYNISIKNDDIRKIYKDHGTEKTEISRGQVPITDSDFLKVREVVNNPDAIELAGKTLQGKDAIRFEKNIDGNLVIITYVSDKHKNLELQTMYKFKNNKKRESATVLRENNAPELNTSKKTGSSTIPINNIIPLEQNYVNNTKKTMNPIEIANLSKEDISSTPKIEFTTPTANGDKQSNFYKNITNNSKFLNRDLRSILKTDEDIEYYKGITNEETLAKAMKNLDEGGEAETIRWAKKDKDFTPEDVTEGWILLKRYQDVGDYKTAVSIARKMRNIATNAGQTVQAFGIMNRLTPEGMTIYAQKELDEAFEKFSENKTKKWIDENEAKFQLTPDETQFIVDKVKEAQGYEKNSYEQKVALAEIQKVMTDKLPPERGQKIKSWMRISMLFNPKTQVRNVAGNAIIAPVNYAGDIVSSIVDKAISKKTGVRTIGTANVKAILKGLKKGASEATNDFRKGINTKSIDGNRFEISQGKSFSENNIIGKSLNRVEATLNYVMDVGDRVFSESWFENSLQNQMVLNNTTEITQEMIDIATQEALSRTWNDNNGYTEFVLNIRKKMNKANIMGYGFGDILIPFAKTPANLTKAIVDYSPIGLVNSLKESINLKNSIEKGTNTAMQQHQFVQNLGKAVAGTLLYIAGYALAKAGITMGDNDDDKDVANFMKNTLGVSSYSIKIGDKTFTYDWAQPIAAPFAIMADLVKVKDSDAELYEKIIDVLDTPVNNILEQSFMSSIQTVFSNNDGVVSGIAEAIEELPSRAVPTFVKQVADLVDGTQRQTYVKGKPIETAINKVKVKIPIVSKKLAPTVDTLGRESKKFGGNNGVFNVFFNPANFNTGLTTKSAEEIYKLYKQTGDKTIMPRVASYSLTYKGKNYNLSTEERAKYQKVMGKYVNDNVEMLLSSKDYKKLSNIQKADIINEIVSDGAELAKEDYANTYNKKNSKNKIEYERSKSDIKVDEEIKKGLSTANSYIYKTIISKKESDKDADDKAISNSSTKNKLKYIMDMEIDDSQKQHLINVSTNDTDYDVSVKDLKKLNGEYLTYLQQSGKQPEKGGMTAREEYMQLINSGISVKQLNKYYSEKGDIEGVKDSSGKTISGSKKQAIFNYVNSLSLSIPQKQILLARENESFAKLYYNDIINYINNLTISNTEKSKMYDAIFKKIK